MQPMRRLSNFFGRQQQPPIPPIVPVVPANEQPPNIPINDQRDVDIHELAARIVDMQTIVAGIARDVRALTDRIDRDVLALTERIDLIEVTVRNQGIKTKIKEFFADHCYNILMFVIAIITTIVAFYSFQFAAHYFFYSLFSKLEDTITNLSLDINNIKNDFKSIKTQFDSSEKSLNSRIHSLEFIFNFFKSFVEQKTPKEILKWIKKTS